MYESFCPLSSVSGFLYCVCECAGEVRGEGLTARKDVARALEIPPCLHAVVCAFRV